MSFPPVWEFPRPADTVFSVFFSILYSPSSRSAPRSPSQLDGRCPGSHPDKVSGSPQLAPLSKNEPSFDKLMELIAVSIRVSPGIMSKNQYLAACSCDLVLSVIANDHRWGWNCELVLILALHDNRPRQRSNIYNCCINLHFSPLWAKPWDTDRGSGSLQPCREQFIFFLTENTGLRLWGAKPHHNVSHSAANWSHCTVEVTGQQSQQNRIIGKNQRFHPGVIKIDAAVLWPTSEFPPFEPHKQKVTKSNLGEVQHPLKMI